MVPVLNPIDSPIEGYFAGGFQLERSVMGEAVASPVGTLIKKRPSAETAYWCLLGVAVPPPTMRP